MQTMNKNSILICLSVALNQMSEPGPKARFSTLLTTLEETEAISKRIQFTSPEFTSSRSVLEQEITLKRNIGRAANNHSSPEMCSLSKRWLLSTMVAGMMLVTCSAEKL